MQRRESIGSVRGETDGLRTLGRQAISHGQGKLSPLWMDCTLSTHDARYRVQAGCGCIEAGGLGTNIGEMVAAHLGEDDNLGLVGQP